MTSFSEPDPFYCNICGGPATTRALLKHSTYSPSGDRDDEDFDEEHELFPDYCSCAAQGHPVSRSQIYPRCGDMWEDNADMGNQNRSMHADSCDFLKGYDSSLVSRWDIKVNTAIGNLFTIGSILSNHELFHEVARGPAHAGTIRTWCPSV